MQANRSIYQLWVGVVLSIMGLNFLCAQAPEDLFDYDHSLEFAHYLENEKAFPMALEEFQRLDQLKPGVLEVREAILRLHLKTNQGIAGVKSYEQWDYHPLLVPATLRDHYIRLNFLGRDFERFERKMREGIGLKEPEKSRVALQLALYQQDWTKAYSLFESFEIQHVRKTQETFAPVMGAISTIRYHNPTQGALLSIVPGLGQAYSRDWKGAFIGLGSVAFSAYGWYHFAKSEPARRGIAYCFSALTMLSYAFNISNGAASARRYNQKQDDKITKWLDDVSVHGF